MSQIFDALSAVPALYNRTMELRDRRVDDWFLMSDPFIMLVVSALYLYLVIYGLPRFMKDRKPFQFKYLLLTYNITMTMFSLILLIKIARFCYLYYISKYVELLDTIFFLLKKKHNQVTVLHVYHHISMVNFTWLGVRFVPGGHGTFFGLVNSAVHVVMYTYYAVAGLGPKYQRFLWWKKYLTRMQLIQFALVFAHMVQLFFIECNYSMPYVYLVCLQAVIFTFLFGNFYIRSYQTKSHTIGAAKKIE